MFLSGLYNRELSNTVNVNYFINGELNELRELICCY